MDLSAAVCFLCVSASRGVRVILSGLKIAFINFWGGFSHENGLIRLLLDQSLGSYSVVARPEDADIVFTSVFGTTPPPDRKRAIAVIGENVRPNYAFYAYSFSSDFDSYYGHNCRIPVWYWYIAWPHLIPHRPTGLDNHHGYEEPVDLDLLLKPRDKWREIRAHPRFACFVANNAELHRMHSVTALQTIGVVDIYGGVARRPWKESKYTLLPHYRFNVCFENSAFPGYYTEKPLQAWVGQCIPLYYADPWLG